MDVTSRINPAGDGPNDTINRAELVGILGALRSAYLASMLAVKILTDSLTSLCQIESYGNNQRRFDRHIHKVLLHNIWSMIEKIHKRGRKVFLGKVRAHTGVTGNETADKLAKQAANGHYDDTITDGNVYYQHLTLIGSTDGDNTRYVTNLRKHVDKQCTEACLPRGVYAELWRDVASHIDSKHPVSLILEQVSTSAKVITLKYNWGVLYNNKLALRYGHPGANGGRCPLPQCGGHDSVGHMTGECNNQVIKSIIIKAHHQVTHRILKAIRKGSYGNYAVFADAGQCSVQYATGTTHPLPSWMGMPSNASRPDILLIQGMPEHKATVDNPSTWYRRNHNKLEHHVIEVGLIRDFSYPDSYDNKRTQHTTIRIFRKNDADEREVIGVTKDLQDRGLTVHTHTLLFGRGGTVYQNTTQALKKLGISTSDLDKLIRKIQRDLLHYLHLTVTTRRQMEQHKEWRPP